MDVSCDAWVANMPGINIPDWWGITPSPVAVRVSPGEPTMTTTRSNESTANNSPEHRSTNLLRDGLIGGVVAILLAFLPLSTVLGGGVAGYLQANGPGGKAAWAGGIAGGISFVPYILVGLYLILVMAVVPPVVPPGYLLLGLLGFGVAYTIGLGVLGALLGAYIRREHVGS